MAKAPDWLLNSVNSAPNLVEDSPQFRAQESEMLLGNLTKASNEAMDAVAEETRRAQMETIRHQARALDAITPMPTPLAGPDQPFFAHSEPSAASGYDGVPSPSEFGPPDAPQPLAGPDSFPTEEIDPATEVERISQATGIPPQVIASMALLGQDLEKSGYFAQQPAEPGAPVPPPTAPAGNMDAPRTDYPGSPGVPRPTLDPNGMDRPMTYLDPKNKDLPMTRLGTPDYSNLTDRSLPIPGSR